MDSESGARGSNAFVKQIFDKKTGKSMICHLHQEEETWQTFSLSWWDSQSIRYERVMELAVAALRREKASALHVLDLLETPACAHEKAIQMNELTVEARRLFDAMSEIESPDLQLYQQMGRGELSEEEYREQRTAMLDELEEKDRDFAKVVEQMNELNRVFSSRNPWVKYYSGIEVPDTLTKAQVRKWTDRVLVDDLTTVEVVLPEPYRRWKSLLPAKWLEDES